MSTFLSPKKKLFKTSGFTLTELLVVIAIITVISGIMIINFRAGEKSGNLQRSAQQVAQTVRRAQNMALASIEYEGEVPEGGYGVSFYKLEPNFYVIYADFNNDGRYNWVTEDEKIETVEFETGIRLDYISPQRSLKLDIAFIPPNPVVKINDQSQKNPATIVIRKGEATCPSQDCRTIMVGTVGWVTIID